MSEFTADTLQQITVDALERTAFVLVDPCEAGDTEAPTLHAKVRFSGPSEGDVIVSASEGFLRELASSLLGVEPDEVDVQAQGMDAIRELANILGGSVLNDIGGQHSTFSLGLPELIDAPAIDSGITSTFDCDGSCLRVSYVNASAAPSKAA